MIILHFDLQPQFKYMNYFIYILHIIALVLFCYITNHLMTGPLVACVASVSVGFGSKERPRNGVFGILPARKMGREPKTERWG